MDRNDRRTLHAHPHYYEQPFREVYRAVFGKDVDRIEWRSHTTSQREGFFEVRFPGDPTVRRYSFDQFTALLQSLRDKVRHHVPIRYSTAPAPVGKGTLE